MKYQVFLISEAEEDILDIFNYISVNDTIENANYVFNKLQETCLSLSSFPEKGHFPPELENIGIYDYKEIHFKPYRIIYEIINKKVFIHCILDGRRSLQNVLERRLIK